MQVKKRSKFNYYKLGNNYRKLYTSKIKVYMFRYIPIYTYKTQVIDFTNLKK
jgi:hypothetical protein